MIFMKQKPRINRPSKSRKNLKRRRALKKTKKWFLRILGFILFGGAVFGIHYLIFQTRTFKLDYFEISGTSKYVNHVDLNNFLYSNYEGKNLLFIDTREIETLLEDVFLGAESIRVKKKLPRQLIVEVKERQPLAILYNDRYPDNYMVDREGYVLGTVDSSGKALPEINYVGDLKVGSFVNQDLVPIYSELIAAFEEYNVEVSSMSFHPKHVSFYTDEGPMVLIDNEKDKFHALSVLSRLLRKLSLEGKDASSIDLRYDKVVVSY